ncbi:hypothetical protein VTL71DRAFT_4970 [Oculimacula yallundae]|uniref:Uncharacterized protein n=1 Tax=Oculimacula yallundae TaxID=86028 RepID=A0ABR4C4P8_9HELO
MPFITKRSLHPEATEPWFDHIESHHPNLLSSIKTLEIHDWLGNIESINRSTWWVDRNPREYVDDLQYLGQMQLFKNLETLHFIRRSENNPLIPVDPNWLNSLAEKLGGRFKCTVEEPRKRHAYAHYCRLYEFGSVLPRQSYSIAIKSSEMSLHLNITTHSDQGRSRLTRIV